MVKRLGGVKMTVKMGVSEGTFLNSPLVYVLLDLKPDSAKKYERFVARH